MAYRWFVLPAVGIVAVLVGVLLWGNLGENLVFYLTPTEAVQRQADLSPGERFRLGGLVVEGSLIESGDTLTFDVTDGASTVRVVHRGAPPQLFQEDGGVVVEGVWQGDHVASDTLLVKHDEQYRSPDGEGPYSPPSREGSSAP